MFSSFGWGEFIFILILGLIIVGPERLPGVIEDVRAAIFAARKAIANAKRELNGELEGFEEFRVPIDTMSRYAAMGPARAVSSLLFEGDEEYLESFDPRRVLAENDASPAGMSGPRSAPGTPNPPEASAPPSKHTGGGAADGQPRRQSGGFSWEDVT